MTTPDVPLRMELTFELPGTPEQVWQAIATANGISAWFMPTDMDERLGGAVTFHMGDDASTGKVTDWEPPHRLTYEEPDWAQLTGHDDAAVTPLVSEFLVEAQSGGTCVLRVVSSAFGVGADWEEEFFEQMEKGWTPFFDNLRLYLVNFPGQHVTSLSVDAQVPGSADSVWDTLRDALAVGDVGEPVEAPGVTAKLERISAASFPHELLLRLDEPVPGYVGMSVFDMPDGETLARIEGYLFSPDAPEYVERERPAWKKWLEALAVSAH
jgi:uncharacterized protein YndB with AHSA1/START domain